MDSSELSNLLKDFDIFRTDARKRWSSDGFDDRNDLFREGLPLDGQKNVPGLCRLRVQCRQIYFFAQAYSETFDPLYLKIARHAWESSSERFRAPGGGYYSIADTQGKVIAEIHLYEQAFVLFALFWLFRVTQDESYLHEAEELRNFITEKMTVPEGGFESVLPRRNIRLQNPHMHLLEAFLFGYMFTADESWKRLAERLSGVFMMHFYDPEHRMVREVLSESFKPVPGVSERVEPGHSGEWIWLLNLTDTLTGSVTASVQSELYEALLRHGIDPEGFARDEIELNGTVLRSSRRLWVQCEVTKAHLARFEHSGDSAALERAVGLLTGIKRDYLRENGLWIEHPDGLGHNLYNYAPASSLYHLNLMLQEAFRVLEPFTLPLPPDGGSL